MRHFSLCVDSLTISFLQEWKRDLKLIAIIMLQVYWLWVTILPLRDFMKQVGTRITWGIFPVFFSDPKNISIIFIGLILLFSDVPFYKEISLYQIARSGKRRYIKARTIYIVVATVIYVFSWVVLTLAFTMPYFSPKFAWGKVVTTLVYTIPPGTRQLFISPSYQNLVEQYTIAEALGLSFLLSLLTLLMIVFAMYLVSIFMRRHSIVPVLIGGILAFVPQIIDTLGIVQELRFIPTSWGRLGLTYKTGAFFDNINLLWRNLLIGTLIVIVLLFAILLLANKKDKRVLRGYWL